MEQIDMSLGENLNILRHHTIMNSHVLTEKSTQYIDILCRTIPGREVGSEGNRRATRFFEEELSGLGWHPEKTEFEAMDWKDAGASLQCGEHSFQVLVGPYSNPFEGETPTGNGSWCRPISMPKRGRPEPSIMPPG